MLAKTQKEKTIYTGSREVNFKTDFPSYTAIFLNRFVLYPLHILQKIFSENKNSMVLYFELVKKQDEVIRN